MSHAGRRIASTAAAAAAVALPVAAAGSAQADTLPLVGSLPVVGNLADSATAGTGNLTHALPLSALPISGLPVVGGLTNAANGASPLGGLPVIGGLTSGGLPSVASLTGNGGASPLSGLPVVGGLTSSLGKGGLPIVGNLPVLGNLAGLGSAATQGGSATMPTSSESVPMQPAQDPPAPAVHALPVPQHATTDAQKLTKQYTAKHKTTHAKKG